MNSKNFQPTIRPGQIVQPDLGPYFLQILSLPNDKILYFSKFKAFADDKLNVAKMMISVCDG